MPTGARTRRRDTRFAVPLAMAVALVVHVILVGGAEALDLSLLGAPFGHAGAATPPKPVPPLATNCPFDAMLATAARAAACLAPWQDPDACFDALPINYRIDRSGCQRVDLPAEVALVAPPELARVKPIDPEPLLEMMKQQPKPPPPQELPKPAPQQPAPPPQQVQARRQMQVVETAKPDSDQAPENARFLSEYNTRVEHESVARGTPKEPMIAKSKPAELTPAEHPKDPSVQQHSDKPPGHAGAPDVPGSLSMRQPGAPSLAMQQQEAKMRGALDGERAPVGLDGYAARRGDGSIQQQQQNRTETPQGQGGAGGGAPDVPNLKPSEEQLQRALGGGNVDHLDDVADGDETALNSKRWIYASFFNRLKRSVAQNWDPASVWARIDPTGQVNGFKTRVTEVRVTLTTSGELKKIVVTSPSGVSDLDDEAVRAFHAAGPFPNPPRELAGSDGNITFAFSFYFEIGAPTTAWHMLRSM